MPTSLFIVETGFHYEGASSRKVATSTREAAEAIAAEVSVLIAANKEFDRKEMDGEEMDGEAWKPFWECPNTGRTLSLLDWVSVTEVPVIG